MFYKVTDLRINEPDKTADWPGARKTKDISVTVECSGYQARSLRRHYESDGLSYASPGEGGSNTTMYLTVPFTDDPRVLAKSIRAEIAKCKEDRDAETLLFGKLSQLGPSAINP